jgi:hypothetical protein
MDAAAVLRAKAVSLAPQLGQNQFNRPLVLESAEVTNRLKGEIFAIVDYPFSQVSVGLSDPNHWCEVMVLHINTKYCRAMGAPSAPVLRVNLGKKTFENLADTVRMEFDYRVTSLSSEYLEVKLSASDGPLGTKSYRIQLDAVALPEGKSFLHLTYSYDMNLSVRMATQAYLKTLGRDKVGFTVTGKGADGQPDYIGGIRGLVERNTMRYYLAIDAFLESARAPAASQLESRLQGWFSASQQYPRQLHEMDREAYVRMKRAEHVRQQSVQ